MPGRYQGLNSGVVLMDLNKIRQSDLYKLGSVEDRQTIALTWFSISLSFRYYLSPNGITELVDTYKFYKVMNAWEWHDKGSRTNWYKSSNYVFIERKHSNLTRAINSSSDSSIHSLQPGLTGRPGLGDAGGHGSPTVDLPPFLHVQQTDRASVESSVEIE